jgi:hypothetical protein
MKKIFFVAALLASSVASAAEEAPPTTVAECTFSPPAQAHRFDHLADGTMKSGGGLIQESNVKIIQHADGAFDVETHFGVSHKGHMLFNHQNWSITASNGRPRTVYIQVIRKSGTTVEQYVLDLWSRPGIIYLTETDVKEPRVTTTPGKCTVARAFQYQS